ncbi:MAG: sigma-54 dependent transcriptional regulator [Thermodesulfobacteriota bacterium]
MTVELDSLVRRVHQQILEATPYTALEDAYHYIKHTFPIDRIYVVQFDPDRHLMRVLAQASETGAEKTNFVFEAMPDLVMDPFKQGVVPETYIINDPSTDVVGNHIYKRGKAANWSSLNLNFAGKPPDCGTIFFAADGTNRITEEHTRLITDLKGSLQLIFESIVKDHQQTDILPSLKEPIENTDEIFRQVTRRLCGNLDLQAGVSHCLQYLSRFMPGQTMIVYHWEEGLKSFRVLAESYGFIADRIESIMPWGQEKLLAEDILRLGKTRLINQPGLDPTMEAYVNHFGTDWSVLVMLLLDKDMPIGVASLGTEGRNVLTEDHLRLFSQLHDPFFIAFSNHMKHREIIRLNKLLEEEKQFLQKELHHPVTGDIVGGNFGLKGVMEMSHLVAGQDSPVLLLGETGVGKELIANFIHQHSARKDGPFIRVNSGAIPETLIDSELFGHEKGAFTGAVSQKIGRFERAHGGTIFLDEIAELPLRDQVRLLRVLQNKIIERVGGTESISVDIRVIAATNRNLEEMVAEGKFREDLWFRLNVFPIKIPPLRARRSDIPALVDHFIEQKSRELKYRKRPTLAPDAIVRLKNYSWPGNVRELENVVERELILSKGGPLLFQTITQEPTEETLPDRHPADREVLSLDEAMSRHIKHVLDLTKGRIHGPNGAAAMLQINPSTLRNRMKKLGI